MRKTRAVTLIELLIAISLIGVLVITMSSLASSLYAMKRDLLDKQQPLIQGNLALATTFERVLRTGIRGTRPAYDITSNGTYLTYYRVRELGPTETGEIWLEGDKIMYKEEDSPEKVILANVSALNFVKDYENRLAVNITLKSGEKFRTCVQPRNDFTPQAVVN